MKTINWLLLSISLSIGLFHAKAEANVILRTPESVVIGAVFTDLDTELIIKSLNIEGYSDKVVKFIKLHLPMAVGEMQQTGIPASVTLAQLILETGYGSSELFRIANNGFGIKEKHKGKSFFYKGEQYKKYDDIGYSFKDHSIHLLDKYHARQLLNTQVRDFREWTNMLVDIDYAEDIAYKDKLNNIIERYSFFKIDKFVWAASDDIE